MSRSPRNNRSSSARETAEPAVPTESDNRSPEAIYAEKIRLAAGRETIEAFVVAFILALLFRAFIAEAFVIPTGSMAPTLMGAHKDITCDRCRTQFQFGASLENRGPSMIETVVAGICPNCRAINPLDLAGDANDVTFSGDRILVSKFSYALHDPERWDVIVFKFPGNPKQNYIKRLVGLPNEKLTLYSGDVYAQPEGDNRDQILRKPADTLLAMRHLVYDTSFQSPLLIDSGYPSRWQPWAESAKLPPEDSWSVARSAEGLTATVKTSDPNQFYWLRYFHHWPSPDDWAKADAGLTLAGVNPYSGRAITDFYAYDSYIHVDADQVYAVRPGMRGGPVFNPAYRSGDLIDQFGNRVYFGNAAHAVDGLHWVGDLIFEADIQTTADSSELMLEIVEAGIKYHCLIDLKTGQAKLRIVAQETTTFDDGQGGLSVSPTASTVLHAGERHRIRFSNCDDELLLWVDDELIQFEGPTTFDSRSFRTPATNRPHFDSAKHPLDAAPVGVAVRGGQATIHHLRIDRDKYYIATKNAYEGLVDYDMSKLRREIGVNMTSDMIHEILASPELWDAPEFWTSRRSVSFTMDDDQFFPMGDNSPESQDARCWAGTKIYPGMPIASNEEYAALAHAEYVPRDLLVGKALIVFWPHYWNRPIPYMPNFQRMKLIR